MVTGALRNTGMDTLPDTIGPLSIAIHGMFEWSFVKYINDYKINNENDLRAPPDNFLCLFKQVGRKR